MPVKINKKKVIEINSFIELNKSQKEKIKKSSALLFNVKDPEYLFVTDKGLISGVVLRFGSKVVDLSLKGKLINL